MSKALKIFFIVLVVLAFGRTLLQIPELWHSFASDEPIFWRLVPFVAIYGAFGVALFVVYRFIRNP